MYYLIDLFHRTFPLNLLKATVPIMHTLICVVVTLREKVLEGELAFAQELGEKEYAVLSRSQQRQCKRDRINTVSEGSSSR